MSNMCIFPCPDPECKAGTIAVHNAYGADPLKGEERFCDLCEGEGVIVVDEEVATAN